MRDVAPADGSRATLDRALVNAREAAEGLKQQEHPAFITPIRGKLGGVLLHLGDWYEARPCLERSLATAQAAVQQGQRRATHHALTGLSNRLQLTLQSPSLRPDDALAVRLGGEECVLLLRAGG